MNMPFHADKGPLIRELQSGDHLVGYYSVQDAGLEPFRDPTRGHFFSLVIRDRTGELRARVWENAEALAEQIHAGQIVKLEGDVESYQNRLQVVVIRMRPARPEEYDLRDMIAASRRDPDEMKSEIVGYIDQISNPWLKATVEYYFGNPEWLEVFAQAPAARRIHHAYRAGLIEHTLEVLTICQTVLRIFPQVDKDLLLAAALLHDIGKVREYEWQTKTDLTDEGRLLGHIVIGDEMVSEAIRTMPDFPPELARRLRHTLVAHHGELEWGSPRRPKTLEAIALHHIENLDAQINRFILLLENRPPGKEWTDYDRLLRRQLYAGPDPEA